jgi:hypothetical protein
MKGKPILIVNLGDATNNNYQIVDHQKERRVCFDISLH